MRRGYIWAGIIGAILLLTTTATWYIGYANATHPAPWPMAGGDAGHRHRAEAPMPEQASLKWTFRVQASISYLPPVVGEDGTVYVGSGDRLTAVSPEGEQRWAWNAQNVINSIALGRQGEVYAQTPEALYAFDGAGQMVWKYPNDLGSSYPIVVGQGGTIYTAGREYLYAITDDGKLKWRFRGRRISSGPVETKRGQILITIDETLHSLSRDGDDLWRIPLSGLGGYMSITALTDGRIVMKADALYISDPEGTLVASQEVDLSVASNPAAGDNFLQFGYTRYDMDGVRTLSLKEVEGARTFGTVVDDQGNSLLVSSTPVGGRIPPKVPMFHSFVGLAMLDTEGNKVWTYQDHVPVYPGAAVAGDRIYFVGLNRKNGAVELVALGNP